MEVVVTNNPYEIKALPILAWAHGRLWETACFPNRAALGEPKAKLLNEVQEAKCFELQRDELFHP